MSLADQLSFHWQALGLGCELLREAVGREVP